MDLSWLQQEAVTIHAVFEQAFYLLATTFILLSVVLDYFKMPMGGNPEFAQLVIRAFVAALLLHAYSDITNAIADVTDAISSQVGDIGKFKLVLHAAADRLREQSWSLASVKQLAIVGISFLTYCLVYVSVYLANAGVALVWVLLYVFSPILIVLYILPATSSATKGLFRAHFEVSAWKIVWSVLSTLLWSTAAADIGKASDGNGFLTVAAYNLLLAVSVFLTPKVVHALVSGGLASLGAGATGLALGAAALSPGALAAKPINFAKEKSSNFARDRLSGGLNAVKSKFSAGERSGNSEHGGGAEVPKWHSHVPSPKEPPLWLRQRLEREATQGNKNNKGGK